MATKVLPVPGTWSWKGDEHDARDHWWHPQSGLMRYLGGFGLEHLCPDEPFVWTTQLDGALRFWKKAHLDWQAGGAALYYYLNNPNAPMGPEGEVAVEDRNLICHSHGLQPVLYACAYRGLRVNRLLSIASPVRADMMPVARAARKCIRSWRHVYSTGGSDWVQWAGEWFDGRVGIVRKHPLADLNEGVPGVGHSGWWRQYALWSDAGWIDWLRSS